MVTNTTNTSNNKIVFFEDGLEKELRNSHKFILHFGYEAEQIRKGLIRIGDAILVIGFLIALAVLFK